MGVKLAECSQPRLRLRGRRLPPRPRRGGKRRPARRPARRRPGRGREQRTGSTQAGGQETLSELLSAPPRLPGRRALLWPDDRVPFMRGRSSPAATAIGCHTSSARTRSTPAASTWRSGAPAAPGMRALQIFTAIPKYYGDKCIDPARARGALPRGARRDRRSRRSTWSCTPRTCSTSPRRTRTKWARAARRARQGARALDRARASARSASTPAPPPTATATAAAERVARGDHAARSRRVKGATRLLVENTAGAGHTIGAHRRKRSARSSRHVPDALRARTGYGLDTCHLFARGYDITRVAGARSTQVLDAFEEATGEAPGFFHLNDSEGALGSNKDRHMLIGDGADRRGAVRLAARGPAQRAASR